MRQSGRVSSLERIIVVITALIRLKAQQNNYIFSHNNVMIMMMGQRFSQHWTETKPSSKILISYNNMFKIKY